MSMCNETNPFILLVCLGSGASWLLGGLGSGEGGVLGSKILSVGLMVCDLMFGRGLDTGLFRDLELDLEVSRFRYRFVGIS